MLIPCYNKTVCFISALSDLTLTFVATWTQLQFHDHGECRHGNTGCVSVNKWSLWGQAQQ